MVDVEANGLGEVLRVKIDPKLFDSGEREMIEDLLAGGGQSGVDEGQAVARGGNAVDDRRAERARTERCFVAVHRRAEVVPPLRPWACVVRNQWSLATGSRRKHEGPELMAQLTESVASLVDQLAKLPGVGRKSAERLAYHLLRVNQAEAMALAEAIRSVRENVQILLALLQSGGARVV